jgi:predicted ATPase/DNA-binding SARP family transcriptional activator
MISRWRIEFFGGLAVCREDERITRFATQKTASLLAYLAFYFQKSHTRETLIELLWPECELNSGRTRLSTLLSYLRHLLEPPGTQAGTVVQADRTTVRLNPDAVTTDVAEFERLLQQATRTEAGAKRLDLLQRAVSLYKGEILPGSYEGWIGSEQSRLSDHFTEALQELGLAYEQAGESERALSLIERALQADPYREATHRAKMRLQAALGHPNAVRESYHALERLFREELGASPSVVTRELAQRLQSAPSLVIREHEVARSLLPAAPLPTFQPSLQDLDNLPDAIRSATLPLQMTRFFGRKPQLAALEHLFLETQTRLITVTGPGGAGKTRIAIEAAGKLAPTLQNRVWFVALADLPDARLISYALARALKLSITDATDTLESIIAFLQELPGVLILDNFEHLLREETHATKGDQIPLDAATALIRLLLERAPLLRCLVTSRRTLRLNGEQEFPLNPLTLPAISALPQTVLTAESVSLYIDRAKLARPDFALTAHNAEAVARLCRKLEGIPLAIEMAAAWAKILPPAKMLERLEERLDALTSRRRDLPARHQSLRATIDWSYDLLTPPQQRLLARLSIFRGGWTLEASEAVCSEEPESLQEVSDPMSPSDILDLLTELADKSLVVSEEEAGEARYRLLETVRQYGWERLTQSGEAALCQARRYRFFMEMAAASWDKIRSSEQIDCLNRLEREQDNMRAALAWSRTEEGRKRYGLEAELDLAGRLRPFWDMRGYWREGRERLEVALRIETGLTSTEIRATALHGAGVLAANMRDYPAAQGFYEACLVIRQQLGDRPGFGSVVMAIGNIAREQHDFAAAHRWYAQSLTVARSLENKWLLGVVLVNLGVLAEYENDDAARLRYNEESLRTHRQIGDAQGIAIAQLNLSSLFVRQQNFPAAYACLTESLTLLQQLGDKRIISDALSRIAYIELVHGRTAQAIVLMGVAQRIREEIGAHSAPSFESNLREAQKELGREVFEAALAQGRAMASEQSLEVALQIIREAQ